MPITQTREGYFLHIQRKNAPRIRRTFQTLRDAEAFERSYLLKYEYLGSVGGVVLRSGSSGAGRLQLGDTRSLLQLLDIWWKYHGITLSDGKRRKAILESMISKLGHSTAATLTPQQFLDYRYYSMYIDPKPVSAKTFNNRHCYLAAMYRTLKKYKVIDYECPIADVEMVKIQQRMLTYLSPKQIETLFDALKSCQNKSVWWIAQVCLRTGSRWSEAENLKRKQLHSGRLTFEFTKSKKTRTVPLDPDFYAELVERARLLNPEDAVFEIGYKAFERIVRKLDLKLPKGQLTHVLRHSFASYFIMNGGNILTLKEILGHSDIKMTMRYAHMAPNHLDDAVRFNPLAGV
jgi:integrase